LGSIGARTPSGVCSRNLPSSRASNGALKLRLMAESGEHGAPAFSRSQLSVALKGSRTV
jgi:hypothetical protein